MSDRTEGRFEPRLAAPRGRGSKQSSFVARVLTAAYQSGSMTGRSSPARRSRPGPRFGRGRVAARVAGASFRLTSRRVTVKVRHVRIRGNVRTAATHFRYLERSGVGIDGEPGRAYGRDADAVDVAEFVEAGRDDRHQFRMIVSAEEGAEVEDLKTFTRTLMSQVEKDLATRLEWVAVDHWDTGHPHTHIVVRGKDQTGQDLVIDREYLTRGLRMRASEVATEWLGPRTHREIAADWNRQVGAERWTGIDAFLVGDAVNGTVELSKLADLDAPARARCQGRLQALERMGLAEKVSPDRWQLSPELRSTLRGMGERNDIIRTLRRACVRSPEFQIFDPTQHSQAIVGRIVGKGLHDELEDRAYLLIEAMDGATHYVPMAPDARLAELPADSIVRVQPVSLRIVDQNIAAASHRGLYRTDAHLQQLRSQGNAEKDPAEFVQSHVRRLEALRRAGMVERLEEGLWRVPDDLPERGLRYDRERSGGAEIRIVSADSIERQRQAIGATWLDQQLIANAQPPSSEFGREVASALRDREQRLIDQGLARRRGSTVVLSRNLLGRLQDRDGRLRAENRAAAGQIQSFSLQE
jgi:type IV secretory pathway VirD2 relaxase